MISLNELNNRKLQEELNISIEWLTECTSTNEVAASRAKDGFRGILGANYQTNGRGRLNRNWESQSGSNLLFSWVMDVDVPITQIARIPLLWSAAIAEALDLYVKWPNDVVSLSGQKCGGILSMVQEVGSPSTVIVGVGLNVNQENFPENLNATSLSLERGEEQSLTEVFMTIVQAIHSVRPTDGFDLWRSRTHMLGQTIAVQGRQGIATGIREDGALIVDGIPITTGDVQLVEN